MLVQPRPGNDLEATFMAKLRWLKKAYFFTFYIQYRCATSFGHFEWGEGNAIFGMALLLAMLILEVVCAVALMAHHTPVHFPKVAVVLGYALLLLFLYSTLVRKHQWLVYKTEFEGYSRRKHFFLSLGVGVMMAVALIGISVIKDGIGTSPQ